MARTKQMIEADLNDCYKAIAEATQFDDALEQLLRRRNELLIELCQARMPVHKQHEAVGVHIDLKTATKLINY
ncbi:MAG: hypothetical protein ACI30B_01745 [Paludibacteraceae bacterium]